MQEVSTEVNAGELEAKVKDVYRAVAENPEGEFHFEMGRRLAEKLGYSASVLDATPPAAVQSFAGVGYHFALANIESGERVLDLGSGSGMDAFIAARAASEGGAVTGVDMTDEQLEKSERLAREAHRTNVSFIKGYIEKLPLEDGTFDVVISNGVINLSPKKSEVFKEIARVLKSGGRMAISDIVTEIPLTQGITCNATLWAACIGGAMQIDAYKKLITDAGLTIETVQENPQYEFLSDSAQGAVKKFGVKSVSILARKL